jgi:hypothetical protein
MIRDRKTHDFAQKVPGKVPPLNMSHFVSEGRSKILGVPVLVKAPGQNDPRMECAHGYRAFNVFRAANHYAAQPEYLRAFPGDAFELRRRSKGIAPFSQLHRHVPAPP